MRVTFYQKMSADKFSDLRVWGEKLDDFCGQNSDLFSNKPWLSRNTLWNKWYNSSFTSSIRNIPLMIVVDLSYFVFSFVFVSGS